MSLPVREDLADHRAAARSVSGWRQLLGSRWLFAVVLAAALGLTWWSWQAAVLSGHQIMQHKFERQTELIQLRVSEGLSDLELALLGGVGLFAAQPEVTRAAWREYVKALRPEEKIAGVQGVGFSQRIAAADLSAHVEKVRGEGFPGYSVFPEGTRSEYNAIVYLEPFLGRNLRAFGFDMATEPVRRQAMAWARDHAQAALSGRVTLVQEILGEVMQQGFLLYLPVYAGGTAPHTVDERRRALRGFVYAPVRAGDFIDQLFFFDRQGLALEVYAHATVEPEAWLYDTTRSALSEKRPPGFAPRFRRTVEVAALGRTWTLGFTSLPSFEAAHDRLPESVTLVFGLACSLLLSGLLFMQAGRIRMVGHLARTSAALTEARDELEQRVQERTAALQQTSSQLQGAEELAGMGSFVLELGTGQVSYSPMLQQLMGLEAGERFTLHRWRALLHPEDRQAAEAALADSLERGKAFNMDFRILHGRNGRLRWLRGIGEAELGPAGEVVRFSGVNIDITERREAELAVQESEGRFAAMADAAPVLIWTSDLDQRCTYFNKTWLDFSGRSLAQELGQGWADGVHPDDLARCLAIAATSFGARHPFRREYRLLRHDGQYRWLLDTAVPRYRAVGSFAGYIGSCIDITERKALLEQSVADARAKTALLREVNHRVTNNLTSILGLLLGEQAALGEAARPVVTPVLERLAQRIGGLLTAHRILSFSQWAPVPAVQLAQQVIQGALAAEPSRQQVKLTVLPSTVVVSPRQASSLALVLNELTTNSIKHGRVLDRPLELRFEACADEGFLILCYRDNGPGFPADVLAGGPGNTGLQLARQLVTETLRGQLILDNDDGAVVTLRSRVEDSHRT